MYYVKKRTHRGLLPKMVRGLLAERRKVKLEMATATGFRKILLNCRQKAIKITANSMYGALVITPATCPPRGSLSVRVNTRPLLNHDPSGR